MNFITLPNTKFYQDNISLINDSTYFLFQIIPTVFLLYLVYSFVKSHFTGKFNEMPLSLYYVTVIALSLCYIFPIFTAVYNIVNSISSEVIFPYSHIEYLNKIYSDINSTTTSYESLGSFSIFSSDTWLNIILWCVAKLLFFLTRTLYVFVIIFIRDGILLISLCFLCYFLSFSFFETARSKTISLITLMLEIICWIPVFCIFLRLIFPISSTYGNNSWLYAASTHGNLWMSNAEGLKAHLLTTIGKSFMLIIAIISTPLMTLKIFHASSHFTATAIFGSAIYAMRNMTRSLSKVFSGSIISKSSSRYGGIRPGSVITAPAKVVATAVKSPSNINRLQYSLTKPFLSPSKIATNNPWNKPITNNNLSFKNNLNPNLHHTKKG